MEAMTFIDEDLLPQVREDTLALPQFRGWSIFSTNLLKRLIALTNIICQENRAGHIGKAIDMALDEKEMWGDYRKIHRVAIHQYYALRRAKKNPLAKTTPTRVQTMDGWKAVEKKGQLPLLF